MKVDLEQPIIKFSEVNFAYENGNTVLENINFTLETGDFACIVGPNGGGKTTLLKLILGLIKPVSGEITVLGKPAGSNLEQIGYVPQFSRFDTGFPVKVRDVVLMGCLRRSFFWGSYSAEQIEKAHEALVSVGLQGKEECCFAGLSGGQKQRALIARALVSQPRLILLDEPTASVDVAGTEQFYCMFEELNKKYTILMVSHDVGFISGRVKSVLCVRKTLQIHPVSELTGEALQQIYGVDVNVIRHDHRCSERGHICPHS
jgi:zinc transport system ATP-binding protein